MGQTRYVRVTEVHNFGGFFGGDTVTLAAVPWPDGDEETLTIDDKALVNVQDRHTIAPEMLLQLDMAGERVDQAQLLGAREYEVLRAALGTPVRAAALHQPRIRAYHCPHCDLWLEHEPGEQNDTFVCRMCSKPLV